MASDTDGRPGATPAVQRPGDDQGPWVTMAVLCQRVEPRDDGTVDVIGIVDGVIVEPENQSDDPLGVRPAARISLTALVSIRAGGQRGAHVLSLRSRYPSQASGPGLDRPVTLTDEVPAASLVVPLELDVHEPGMYEFDASFDDRLLTRMSLWVGYR